MKSISAAEANRSFSRLLREVEQGETFVVTSRGRPVATIAPPARAADERHAAKERLLARLQSQPILNLPRWKRDSLYDDA